MKTNIFKQQSGYEISVVSFLI